MLLVAADGTVAYSNEPARAMLARGDQLQMAGNVLRAVAAETDRALRDIFLSAAKGDASLGVRGVAVPLSGSEKEQWFAHVLPLTSGNRRQTGLANHAVAAIFIRQASLELPASAGNARQSLYKLTASEVRVLERRAAGQRRKGDRQHARALAVDDQNPLAQPVPQDRNAAAERSRQAGRRHPPEQRRQDLDDAS